MFKKINNKVLFLIFILLAAIVVAVSVYDSNKGERTFKSELFAVDSTKVSSITIIPKIGKSKVMLVRTGKNWEVRSGGKSYPADTSVIRYILQTLSEVKTQRVSGTTKLSWKQFDLEDSSSTRVIVEQGKETTADFRYGKISYSQNSRMGGNRNVDVKTNIRLPNDAKVYVVEGFYPMMLSPQVSAYRYKNVFRFNKDVVTKLSFIYKGDSSFVLSKKDNKWLLNDKQGDSLAIDRFINALSKTSCSDFADDLIGFPPVTHRLIIEGNNMIPIEVKGATDNLAKKYYINSSYNSSVNFGSDNHYVYDNIFISQKRFAVKKDQGKSDKKKK